MTVEGVEPTKPLFQPRGCGYKYFFWSIFQPIIEFPRGPGVKVDSRLNFVANC